MYLFLGLYINIVIYSEIAWFLDLGKGDRKGRGGDRAKGYIEYDGLGDRD